MATFLHRASGNASGVAPSVNAATMQGMTPAQITGRLAYTKLEPVVTPFVHSSSKETAQASCPSGQIVFKELFSPNAVSTNTGWAYVIESGDLVPLTTNGRPTGYSVTYTSVDFSNGGPGGQEGTSPEQWDATITLECIGVEPVP